MFAWCISFGGGFRASSLGAVAHPTGGALGWAMLNGINSCLGVTSALLVNVRSHCPASQKAKTNMIDSNRILLGTPGDRKTPGGAKHLPSSPARRLFSSLELLPRRQLRPDLVKLTGINGISSTPFLINSGLQQHALDVSLLLLASSCLCLAST